MYHSSMPAEPPFRALLKLCMHSVTHSTQLTCHNDVRFWRFTSWNEIGFQYQS